MKEKWLKLKNSLRTFFVPEEKNGYLPKALTKKPLFCYAFLLLVLKILIILFWIYFPSTQLYSAISSQRVLDLINSVRAEKNLAPVSLDIKLAVAADYKSADMLANDYFEHTSPSGISPWHWFNKAGYNYLYAGENLALDFNESDEVFNAWMESPTHRANILNPNFNEIGISVRSGQLQNHQATVAVLLFGQKKATKVKIQTAAQTPAKTPENTNTPAPAKTPQKTPAPTPSVNSAPNAPAAPIITVAASPEPEKTIEPTEPGIELQIPAETLARIYTEPASNVQKTSYRVLGAFVSRSAETLDELYLYFALFLTIALLINILVKIEIQRWPAIFGTTGIIIMSIVLTLI